MSKQHRTVKDGLTSYQEVGDKLNMWPARARAVHLGVMVRFLMAFDKELSERVAGQLACRDDVQMAIRSLMEKALSPTHR